MPDSHATPDRATQITLYDKACPECGGKVYIEDGVYWAEVEAEDEDNACCVCGGPLDAE